MAERSQTMGLGGGGKEVMSFWLRVSQLPWFYIVKLQSPCISIFS